MIYTRWNQVVSFEGLVTDVEVEHLEAPVTLVKCDDGRFRFAEFLRADGGYNEINAALRDVPALNLSSSELEVAIKEAS